MRKELLAGAATLALVSGAWGSAWAQTANDDTNTASGNTESSIAQDDALAIGTDDIAAQIALQAAVFAGANGAENGAIVDNVGNAIGAFSEGNDQVSDNSSQTNTSAFDNEAFARNDSFAIENGAVVDGKGVAIGSLSLHNAAVGGDGAAIATDGSDLADDGSAVQLGTSRDSSNKAAAAEDGSAAVNTGVAISTASGVDGGGGPAVDDGSSLVVGDENSTASADDHSASVGGYGTAIAVDLRGFDGENGDGGEAEGVFGVDNVVAESDLEQETTGIDITVRGGNNEDDETTQSLATGNIDGHTVGSITGVNMAGLNTGLVNQGASVSVSAIASFGQ